VKDDLVLVSNRGPVSFVEMGGQFQTKRGAGGLAGALDPVARRLGDHAVWIATATSDTDRDALKSLSPKALEEELGYELRLLEIDPDVYDRYYNIVSNRMLWFANHCLWDEIGEPAFGRRELDAWADAYEPVNVTFAESVLDIAGPKALVVFQDYHLATAPGHLRDMGAKQVIGHFTHSSFCGPAGLGRLPDPIPKRVIEGMLGADLLGFHVGHWAQNFYECCRAVGATVDVQNGVVEHRSRRTWVRTYPIPIDPRDIDERVRGQRAREWAGRLLEDGRILLVRADRAEPSKNIVRGFEAFGLLLDRREDLREKLHFVACLYPSRQEVPEYRRYTEDFRRAVDEVNARHPGSVDLFLWNDYDRTIGALSVYDALLVNPIIDGMNLVAKEGPTANERDGVLILSRGAGAFEELGDYAVEINDPYDVIATAAAIERAIEMPTADRRERAEALRKIVDSRLPADWIEAQLDDLTEIAKGRAPVTAAPRGESEQAS
jgi:trehalose 6-phosphate synthase